LYYVGSNIFTCVIIQYPELNVNLLLLRIDVEIH